MTQYTLLSQILPYCFTLLRLTLPCYALFYPCLYQFTHDFTLLCITFTHQFTLLHDFTLL